MSKQGKFWGRTFLVYNDDNCEFQYMECKAGKKCSDHKHEHKVNIFWCISGKIRIKVWKKDYDLVDETILTAYQSTKVNSGEYHTFEVLEDAQVLEIYYVKLNLDDIQRKSCGGDIISSNSSNLQYDSNGLLINNDNLSYQN